MFRHVLERLAAEEGTTLGRFLTKLHDEVQSGARAKQIHSRRCFDAHVLPYVENIRDAADLKVEVPLRQRANGAGSESRDMSAVSLRARFDLGLKGKECRFEHARCCAYTIFPENL